MALGNIVTTPCGARGRVFRIIDGYAFVAVTEDTTMGVRVVRFLISR